MGYPYVDMHCDTLLRSMLKGSSSLYDGEGMQSIKKMREAGQMCQFFAVFFPPRDMPAQDGFQLPEDEVLWRMLTDNLTKEVEAHSDIIAMARSAEEIRDNFAAGKMSAVLSIEDGRMVNGDMERLISLKEQGVCAISLTWNFPNCFGAPNSKDRTVMNTGLTPFGKEAVGVMNDLGILVDVSHLSDGGFWDVVKLTRKPFVATHSNCRALCPHTRNLTDEMIRALSEKGGVSGINFGPEFLNADTACKDSRVEELVAHVLHFIKVGGEDCVGLGTDFDGIGGSFEIGHPTEMDKLFAALSQKGLTERQLDKLGSGNVLRVMEK